MPTGRMSARLTNSLHAFERIAEFHEHRARIIREAMKLITEDHAYAVRDDAAMATAMAAIGESRTTAPGYGARRLERERRRASADLLATFDPNIPREAPAGKERAVAPLIRHGYLKKRGDGYVRTVKAFDISPPD